MLLSVGITLFASTALDGTVWTFPHLVERVIQNNTTTIFPMCITLIAGYIIAREKSDDTLKSIMTIPVSYPALIGGKLIVCGFLSVFLGMASTFFTVGKDNNLIFDLATDAKVSTDGLVYTYTLRKDAVFSDGKPLTAKDVVFTFEKTMKQASAADLTMLEKVVAKDDYTVAFTLKKKWSTFPYSLSEIGIVPAHAYKDGFPATKLGPTEIVNSSLDVVFLLLSPPQPDKIIEPTTNDVSNTCLNFTLIPPF